MTSKEVSFSSEVWSDLAETCGKNLKKGRGVRVVGRLKQDRWKDQGGKNHERVKIVAEHVEFKPVFSGRQPDSKGQSMDELLEEAV
jgi:single-strand DNA-binding protein